MSKSVAIKAVSVDFLSQVSDLRKRREHLMEAQFFHDPTSEEYKNIIKELGAMNRALDVLDGLEVDCD